MPRLVLHNAEVLTQDFRRPRARAVSIRDGRIEAVGSDDDVLNLRAPGDLVIDLGGRTLLPGFNDAHIHVWKVGRLLDAMLDARGAASIDELAARVRAWCARLAPGAWFLGRGYNEALLRERRHPLRADLDRACPDRPALLVRTCAHVAVANSAALRIAGIGAAMPNPPGGAIDRDETGEPTGVLRETAIALVERHVPSPSRADDERAILAACERLLAAGVTSATDPAVHPALHDAYVALDGRGALPLRMNLVSVRRPDGGAETLEPPPVVDRPMLRCDAIKLFADGGLSGGTAALASPYRDSTDRGILRLSADEIVELAREPHLRGLRVCTHAIGDRAIDAVLGAYEALARLAPGPRHRIEHFGLPTPEHLRRCARARCIVATQPIFLRELGANFRARLDDAHLARTYPFRSMTEAGIDVAFSSDAPVVRDFAPLSGIAAALSREDADGVAIAADERITLDHALRAFTMGGAIASCDDARRGSIAAGKDADLVALEGSLEDIAQAADAVRVCMTIIAGRIVHDDLRQEP